MPDSVTLEPALPWRLRSEAASLYWQAFSGRLGRLLSPEPKALRFLEAVLDPAFAISALSGKGDLLGLAGFKTEEGAFVGGDLAALAQTYGWLGALWRGPLLATLDRKIEPGLLLMDGLCVAESARGRGIGSALLDAVAEEAARRGLSAVRLDVIDSNPLARKLYERKGFQAVGQETTGPLRFLLNFRSATTMVRPLPSAE